MDTHALIKERLSKTPKGAHIIEEASFGARYLEPYVRDLGEGAAALDVGAGACLLVSTLAQKYPKIRFEAVEPGGQGFEFLKSILSDIKENQEFQIHVCDYNDLKGRTYDLIYLVNVIEHLPNWRDFIDFVDLSLKSGGRCVVLCPNYGFPYESHFRIPIIVNPAITYRLFKTYIEDFERTNDSRGLWNSLNFIKLREVEDYCDEKGLGLKVNNHILDDLIQRLGTDRKFAQRQRLLKWPARIVASLGLLRFFKNPILMRYQPYMFLEIFKA